MAVTVVGTTVPGVSCVPSVNPSGNNIPAASKITASVTCLVRRRSRLAVRQRKRCEGPGSEGAGPFASRVTVRYIRLGPVPCRDAMNDFRQEIERLLAETKRG